MTLDDPVVPTTKASAAAREVAATYLSPALLNHSERAYMWAAAYGQASGIPFDAELLYVAALFHDLGLTANFDSHTVAFEVAGGHVAAVFAAGAGWTAHRRTRVSEVIVRHQWQEVDVSTDAEGHLLARSTATDVVGFHLENYDADFTARVLERYPRLDFREEFVACFQDQAERKPDSSAAGVIRVGLGDLMARNPLEARL